MSLLVFAPETYDDNDLNVRVFADCGGVPEDPATGSSNGCLAAYLVREDYFKSDEIEVTVE
ncbi:PhzF family phenazine biosynthesis protein [Halalkalicoccus paucihalophilus]|uniref:PhzF family phenazine biosynthesis protein n=1 Tax=Halalkalicoccus paucihalophilus TaxID=1008153 RepID=UPI001FDEFEE7|nr:PhzF family phenazine biosynthesis protein [Halalkalicoccus paucihalophilus]